MPTKINPYIVSQNTKGLIKKSDSEKQLNISNLLPAYLMTSVAQNNTKSQFPPVRAWEQIF